ncbi:hypothetical protein [Hymenobacter sp. BT730]|uniref:hypothetical protein n=1 Tax=Hymenobacter sp. BT730 TaxID=3063332 RepID=UPI0026E03DA8|nr:hypothetical protein [Hymenobacter sp. BT730]
MRYSGTKWGLWFLSGIVLPGLGFILLVLNPGLLYAHKTATPHYTIYHTQALDATLMQRLEQARDMVQQSPCFDDRLHLEVCLNDGSWYPRLVEKLWGPAFGWGFANKVVLNGEVNSAANWVALHGYHWNLVRLLAHEATHCYQVHQLGWWHSNPLARYPSWKWEGYAEYVAHHTQGQATLLQSLEQLQQAESITPGGWDIHLADGTSIARSYFKSELLIRFCLEIQKRTYQQVLQDTTAEESIYQHLLRWGQAQRVTMAAKHPYLGSS